MCVGPGVTPSAAEPFGDRASHRQSAPRVNQRLDFGGDGAAGPTASDPDSPTGRQSFRENNENTHANYADYVNYSAMRAKTPMKNGVTFSEDGTGNPLLVTCNI